MNLWGIVKGLLVQDENDRTKELSIEIDPAATTGTRTTLKAAQTVDRTITLPDNDSELVDLDSAQELENKTIDFSSGGTNTLVADAEDVLYDNASSGLSAANVQDAVDEVEARVDVAEAGLAAHIADASDAHDASAISNVPAGSIAATDVQSAINELDGDSQANAAAIAAHVSDASDAHDASAISNIPSGNLAATDVQTALDELQTDVDTRATQTSLDNHVNDASDAHDASAISNIPSGNLAATDVQAALNELQTDIDGISSGSGTASNLGAGAQVFKQKVLDDFQFRTIVAGANITVNQLADTIEIVGAASGANTLLSNLTSPTAMNQDLFFDNTASRVLGFNSSNPSNPGRQLTIAAGYAAGTDISGGPLNLSTGASTGNAGAFGISFFMPPSGQGTGTSGRSPLLMSEMTSTVSLNTFRVKATLNGGSDLNITNAPTGVSIIPVLVNSAGAAPRFDIQSAPNVGTGTTGDMVVASAASSTGISGALDLKTGDVTGFGSGNGFLRTGSGTNTGSMTISTGAATATAGNIILSPGTGAGAVKGQITLNGLRVNLNSALVGAVNTYAAYGVVNTTGLDHGNLPIIIMQTTTAITIHGIAAGVQGQMLIIYNENNNNISFANESGTEPVAANRIRTNTGATFTSTGTSCHQLVYLSSRWILLSHVA